MPRPDECVDEDADVMTIDASEQVDSGGGFELGFFAPLLPPRWPPRPPRELLGVDDEEDDLAVCCCCCWDDCGCGEGLCLPLPLPGRPPLPPLTRPAFEASSVGFAFVETIGG